MSRLGGDATQTEQLSVTFRPASRDVSQSTQRIATGLDQLLWSGTDATGALDGLRADTLPLLVAVAESLWRAASLLTHQASAQRSASGMRGRTVPGSGRRSSGSEPPPVASAGGDAVQSSNGIPYEIGPTKRPDIHHDNGFLQDPDDSNNEQPTATREPTDQEQRDYEAAKREAFAGDKFSEIPFGDRIPGRLGELLAMDDAIEAYRHFLVGGGADRTFDYEKFLSEDPVGEEYVQVATRDFQSGAEAAYAHYLTDHPEMRGRVVTLDVTGGAIATGAGLSYPESENWQKAIGGHTFWTSGRVTVTPQAGGAVAMSTDMSIYAEDRYNFNPNQHDIATGVPDSDNGRFEQSGLAHQYTQTGSADRALTWNLGDAAPEVVSGDGGR